ncbi:hypothetical protein IPL68_03850 [Candidatus Saccharibacteria bacterium]|nr:MAG: hypothetical protein IPL68_03850 [Candidatus Saccharibacteria bacterium]
MIHLTALKGRQRGDTIIEVLIASAIASLVLTSAYALTNKNVGAIQEAQEQSVAQKLVEQQVELLRAASAAPVDAGCYSGATYVLTPNSACNVTNGGAQYQIQITPPSGGSVFTIQSTMDHLEW